MEIILVNAVGRVRRVVENGREYLVAPMTLIVPGVLNGSQGALFYPDEENRKASWNRIPITVRHPYDPVTNQPLSAKGHGVLERQGIGDVRNARYKGKLVAEGWFDVQRTKAVDERVYNALKAGQRLELSTGLFTRNDPSPGTYNGKSYTHVARDHRPDHLAVLPDEVGACSVRDGCGVLVNQSGGEDVSDPIRNSFWSWLGGVLRITANADQMKHLETGQFLNKKGAGTKQTHAAAEKGLKKTSGHEQPPADDPDDDGDEHATVVGQGDRSDGTTEPTGNANPEGINQYTHGAHAETNKILDSPSHSKAHSKETLRELSSTSYGAMKAAKAGDSTKAMEMHGKAEKLHSSLAAKADARNDHRLASAHQAAADAHGEAAMQHERATKPTDNEALMYGQDPHQASKDAASMDHPEAREHAVGAVDASNDDDPKTAAKLHTKAADVHEATAVDARVGKEPDAADEHDRAAALHRKAAGMHSASALTRNTDDKPLKPKKATAMGSAQAASDAAAHTDRMRGVTDNDLTTPIPSAVKSVGEMQQRKNQPGAPPSGSVGSLMAPAIEAAKKVAATTTPPTDNDDDETMNKKKGDCAMNRDPVVNVIQKLTANERAAKLKELRPKMLTVLTANCQCDKEKSGYPLLNNETLATLVVANAKAEGSNADATGSGTVQVGGEEDEDEAADAKFKGAVKKKGVMNAQQWLAEAPPEIQSVVQNAINVEAQQKSQLVKRLVANVADEKQRTRLATNLMMKTLGELRDLSLLAPAPPQRTVVRNDYQPDPLYVGMGGGGVDAVTDNAAGDDADDVLDFTANRAAVAEEFVARRTG